MIFFFILKDAFKCIVFYYSIFMKHYTLYGENNRKRIKNIIEDII